MADSGLPLFTAVASSARQLYFLLRCISFASKVDVRITSEGLRFSASETGVLESFIFLSKSLFQTYRLQPTTTSAIDPPPSTPPTHHFSLPLSPLLSTLQILSATSEPASSYSSNNRSGGGGVGVSGPYSSDAYSSSFAAHRLTRHGGGVFAPSVVGTSGQCRIVYRAAGGRLELSVPETGGVRTAGELSTYVPAGAGWGGGGDDDDGDADGGDGRGRAVGQEIPFDRDDLRMKVILPSSVLGDAVVEIGALGPPEVFVVEGSGTAPYLVLRGEGGSGGECRVEFGDEALGVGGSRSKLLETFLCQSRIRARYAFGTVKKALVAMRAGTKVSLRIDGQGVLSLQFLIELVEGSSGNEGKVQEEVAFVDFRIVPLFEGQDGEEGSSTEEDEE